MFWVQVGSGSELSKYWFFRKNFLKFKFVIVLLKVYICQVFNVTSIKGNIQFFTCFVFWVRVGWWSDPVPSSQKVAAGPRLIYFGSITALLFMPCVWRGSLSQADQAFRRLPPVYTVACYLIISHEYFHYMYKLFYVYLPPVRRKEGKKSSRTTANVPKNNKRYFSGKDFLILFRHYSWFSF